MMAGNPSWWSMIPPPSQQPSSFISSTPAFFPSNAYLQSSLPLNSLPDHVSQDQLPQPQSWSQFLLGGISGDEDRYGSSHFNQPNKKLENWEDQILNSSSRSGVVADHIKREENSNHLYGQGDEEFQQQSAMPTTWSQQQVIPVSSPRSCVTSISNSNILDFSYNNKAADGKNQHPDQSSECNSTATGGVCKKARVQPSQSQPPLKVRKEKLGDRITTLHQLVSPFGKTDTASVLLEAIGYIRFLQGQIEALSSPYLGSSSSSSSSSNVIRSSDIEDRAKDLRSRGLCLVPVSCTQHVGSENGADYWAPAIGGGF